MISFKGLGTAIAKLHSFADGLYETMKRGMTEASNKLATNLSLKTGIKWVHTEEEEKYITFPLGEETVSREKINKFRSFIFSCLYGEELKKRGELPGQAFSVDDIINVVESTKQEISNIIREEIVRSFRGL